MSEPTTSRTGSAPEPTQDEKLAALFVNHVLQQTQIGLMLMGQAPHPESGKTMRDLDHAQVIIDQLEMIEAKTRGNLSKEEQRFLQQSLMTLRMAFVEAVEAAPGAPTPPATDASTPAPQTEAAGAPPAAAPAAEDESRKKFTKKY